MKKKITLTLLCLVISLVVKIEVKAQANDIYWAEGFEQPNTISNVQPPANTAAAPYWASTLSGYWYMYGSYRTNTTTCGHVTESDGTDTIAPNHIRMSENINFSGNPDSAYIVTPIVSFGVGELHFVRNQAQRPYGIYWTADTGAVTTNWNLVYTTPSSVANLICADTAISINEPTAKRIKIQSGKPTLNYDLDSVWLTSYLTIVPVTFGGISAIKSNGIVKVSWSIQTALNVKEYIVERSSDGAIFSPIGTLNANGASNYKWLDNSPIDGNSFYKIEAIDINGSSTNSTIVEVSDNNKPQGTVIIPNPIIGGEFKLQLNNLVAGNYSFDIYSIAGQRVYSSAISYTGGSYSSIITLPSNSAKGLYNVHIVGGSFSFNKSIVVE